MRMLWVRVSNCKSQAGNRSALAQSAEYPRDFVLAVASLVPERGSVPSDECFDLMAYQGVDHLNSLDDLTKGRSSAWWRKAFDIYH